ncbi:MAG: DUF1540 domain-containing protein [Clostridia bacterium]
MDNLICHTANCEHNIKSRCIAGIINVSGKGVCTSKIKRDGGVLAQTFADIEASEDFNILDSNNTVVSCQSMNCVHNETGVCSAGHIIVDDGLFKTHCYTRTKSKT